jgi:hypothetical protein
VTQPPDDLKHLGYQTPPKPSKSTASGAWVAFGLFAAFTLLASAVGMFGLFGSRWGGVFLVGAVVIMIMGFAATRFLKWPALIACILVCVCILLLLIGTCAQGGPYLG